MTVKDAILAAMRYLDISETEEGLSERGDFWLSLAKDVIAEICSDYYPLKITEVINSNKDGLILNTMFSKPVIDIFRVSCDKINLPFITKYDCIDVGIEGKLEVEYSFMPLISDLSDFLPFTDKIPARVIGYGIAAEYCIINSPEDALLFDKRYKDALKKATKPRTEKRVRGRLWL